MKRFSLSANSTTSSFGLGSLTKSVSGAISSLPTSLPSLSIDAGKKPEEKTNLISQTLALLEDVKIQSPVYHSGLVLVYSAATLAPLTNSGVSFRWYKIIGDQFNPVDETAKAWYAPTIDDIGSKICAQCEDVYDQGCSRYLESSVLRVDPLLQSVVSEAIEKCFIEVKDTSVSIGTKEKEVGEASDEALFNPRSRPTVLSEKNGPFVQLEGRSSIEIDGEGIFISLPIPGAASNTNDGSMASAGSGATAGLSSVETKRNRKVRRGLYIPASDTLSVHCFQPAALVLSLPLMREGSGSSSDSPAKASAEGVMGDVAVIPAAGQLVQPWTYIRVLKPHDATASRQGNQNVDEEELEASSFASILISLESLLASLSVSCKELKISISCGDRLQRDALVSSIRALCRLPLAATAEDRKACLPWLKEPSTVSEMKFQESAPVITTTHEWEEKLKSLQEENEQLKQQQLSLGQPQELRGSSSQLSESTDTTKLSVTSPEAATSDEESADNDATRMLSMKVIELENKLAAVSKRESAATRMRHDLEQKVSKLTGELEEKSSRLEITERDLSVATTDLVEQRKMVVDLKNELKREIDESSKAKNAMADLDLLRPLMKSQDLEISSLRKSCQSVSKEVESLKPKVVLLEDLKSQLESTVETLQRELSETIESHQQQTEDTCAHVAALQREIEELKAALDSQRIEVQRAREVMKENDDLMVQNDKLNGEINHLNKRAESQGRDLKRTMKENAQTLSEYEKALIRKSGECDELGNKVQELKEEIRFLTEELNSLQRNGLQNIGDGLNSVMSNLSMQIGKVTTEGEERDPPASAAGLVSGSGGINGGNGNGEGETVGGKLASGLSNMMRRFSTNLIQSPTSGSGDLIAEGTALPTPASDNE